MTRMILGLVAGDKVPFALLLLVWLAACPPSNGFLSSTKTVHVQRHDPNFGRSTSSSSSSSSAKSTTQLSVKRVKGKQPKKQYKPLHHSSRQKDPLLVEHDLLSERSSPTHYNYILGSDESGTGCIAGPVVTATCCCLPDAPTLPGVLDGKRLNRSQRRAIYQQLMALSQDNSNDTDPPKYLWTTAIRTAAEIDAATSVKHAIMDCFQESIHEMVYTRLPNHQQQQFTEIDNNPDKDVANNSHHDDIRAYSIVDGSSSPKNLEIPSRPWPQGDNVVYSVALASIIASVVHDDLMEKAASLYPEYGFDAHKGYSTPAHTLALHQYGPSPIHRASCKPLKQRGGTTIDESPTTLNQAQENHEPKIAVVPTIDNKNGMDRTAFLNLLLAGSTSAVLGTYNPPNAQAMYTDSKSGIRLPDKGEIESAVPSDWSDIDNPLTSDQQLTRLDSSNDALFYQDARFVEHVDEGAVKIMTQYIARVWQDTQPSAVLDLCASHVSHFPTTTSSTKRIAGLGMNAKELQANPILSEWVVQDLNDKPQLPYADNSFDLLFCQLSIDYLTKPLQVCREMARVLKPGGSCHILFSNRLFIQKAVALWTGADDIDHAFTVASYLHFSCDPSTWGSISAQELSVRKNGRVVGDPMYVVTATKSKA